MFISKNIFFQSIYDFCEIPPICWKLFVSLVGLGPPCGAIFLLNVRDGLVSRPSLQLQSNEAQNVWDFTQIWSCHFQSMFPIQASRSSKHDGRWTAPCQNKHLGSTICQNTQCRNVRQFMPETLTGAKFHAFNYIIKKFFLPWKNSTISWLIWTWMSSISRLFVGLFWSRQNHLKNAH